MFWKAYVDLARVRLELFHRRNRTPRKTYRRYIRVQKRKNAFTRRADAGRDARRFRGHVAASVQPRYISGFGRRRVFLESRATCARVVVELSIVYESDTGNDRDTSREGNAHRYCGWVAGCSAPNAARASASSSRDTTTWGPSAARWRKTRLLRRCQRIGARRPRSQRPALSIPLSILVGV